GTSQCRTFGPLLIAQRNPRPYGRGYYLPGLRPWLRQVSSGFETASDGPSPPRNDFRPSLDSPGFRLLMRRQEAGKPLGRPALQNQRLLLSCDSHGSPVMLFDLGAITPQRFEASGFHAMKFRPVVPFLHGVDVVQAFIYIAQCFLVPLASRESIGYQDIVE